jgi:prepilin-type N-terminal cleavage/methylation domain-containing protein
MEEKTMNLRNTHGMTLVEILVALALLGIIFSLVILPFTKSFDLMRRARAVGSLESAMMLALRQVEQDISRARILYFMKSPYDLQDGEIGDDDSSGRIDIVLANDSYSMLLVPQDKIVTYYGRPRDPSKPPLLKPDPRLLNPRVLFRAEHSALDRDGDGKYAEDPIDGIDNDSDGAVDEDPFDGVENAITPLDGTDLAGLRFYYDEVANDVIVDMKLQKIDPTSGGIQIRRQIRINLDKWVEVIKW